MFSSSSCEHAYAWDIIPLTNVNYVIIVNYVYRGLDNKIVYFCTYKIMSTVIADTYTFSNLAQWEYFYIVHRDEIDKIDTRWLNKHITISDNGKFYKIMKRKNGLTGRRKLYLKPIVRVKPEETTADLTLHTLNLIITKLQDIQNGIDRTTYNTERSDDASSLPNKSVIERVKEIKPDQT